MQALHRLNTVEMSPLLAYLTEMLDQTRDALIHADSSQFQRLQGRAGVLKELVDAVRTSAEALNRLQ